MWQPTDLSYGWNKFTEFEWAEYKDLAKNFLTLIVGVLVFSVTFSEKIVDFQKTSKPQRAALVITWCFLIFALVGTGLGIWLMYQACLFSEYAQEPIRLGTWAAPMVVHAYWSINLAGVAFGLALIGIVVAGMLSVFRKSEPALVVAEEVTKPITEG